MKYWIIFSSLVLVIALSFIVYSGGPSPCSFTGIKFKQYFAETKAELNSQGIDDLEFKELTPDQTYIIIKQGTWTGPDGRVIEANPDLIGRVINSAKAPNNVIVSFSDSSGYLCVAVAFTMEDFMKFLENKDEPTI